MGRLPCQAHLHQRLNGDMTDARWEALPAELRGRIDDLVLRDQGFRATAVLFHAVDRARLGLYDCQDLIAQRCRDLADQIEFQPEPARDLATLITKVEAMARPPVAIEAVWDGDTQGWFVILLAITADPWAEEDLAYIRHGGDIRVFNGEVPPWPEAVEASATGGALAAHFGIPFHFGSPATPDDEAPRWWK